jgi:hypothetical protein
LLFYLHFFKKGKLNTTLRKKRVFLYRTLFIYTKIECIGKVFVALKKGVKVFNFKKCLNKNRLCLNFLFKGKYFIFEKQFLDKILGIFFVA